MLNNTADDDHDQVGIGTLIVFTAMVLVATITAGVFVGTAGFLQATVGDAGGQPVSEVTNHVEVLNIHGTIGGEEDIDNITLTVRLAVGSDAMDMSETPIRYLSGDGIVILINQTAMSGANSVTNDSTGGIADNDEFGLSEVIGDDGLFGVLSSMNGCYEATIDTAAIETSDGDNISLIGGLSAGGQVILEIISHTGGATQVILTISQWLAGRAQNEPVEL